MSPQPDPGLAMGAQNGEEASPFVPVELGVDAGRVATRFYPASAATAGVVLVGGVGGGWDSPARGLYERLAEALQEVGIAAMRVRYRDPRSLDACVEDVLAGARFLEGEGVRKVGLVGHSMGGAVVIQAAAAARRARTVVTLATQSFGTASVRGFDDACSILLIHGMADEVLPYSSSVQVHEEAGGPSQIELLPDVGHVLDEAADVVYDEVFDWLTAELSSGGDA